MTRSTITITTDIDLDVATAAKWFACLDDEQQTQFIKEVADEMHSWGPGKLENQMYYIGNHVADCECSSSLAIDLIRALSSHMEARIKTRKNQTDAGSGVNS